MYLVRKEMSDIKVTEKAAYLVSKYDNVYIVLKGVHESFEKRIWLSASKQKYFFRGRIIEWSIMSPDGQHVIKSYPREGSVAFVDHRDWHMFSTCKYDREKEKLIIHVHYSYIAQVILDFESFDWKR